MIVLSLSASNRDFDALSETKRLRHLPEGDLHEEDTRVRRSRRVVRLDAPPRDRLLHLLDISGPGSSLSFSGDRHGCTDRDVRGIELVDLGLDPEPRQIGDAEEARARREGLAFFGVTFEDRTVEGRVHFGLRLTGRRLLG